MAGVAGLGASLALANQAGQFEQEMAKVSAISSIATDSLEATQLETKALDAAMRTQFSPQEAAQGLQNFASQGFRVKEQMEALTPALRLAQAGMIPVADSATAMTAALKVFKKPAEEAADVTDKLLKITTLTSLQANDLSLALGTVGRGAGLANQNIEEMLVSMGLVKNTGVDTSVAASSVSSALQFMAKNAKAFEKNLGVSVTDSEGNFRDFIDVVLDADQAMSEKYTDSAERAAAATKLFGRFGVTAFQAVSSQIETGVRDMEGNLLKGAEAVDFLRSQLQDAAGTAEEFEKKILSTFEGQKKLLEGVVQSLAVSLGKPFAAAFSPLVTGIRDGIETIVSFVNAMPEDLKNVLAKIALAFFALTTAIGGFIAMRGAITLISSSMSMLGITAGTIIGPLLGIIAVLGVAGLVFAAFRAHTKSVGEATGPLIKAWEKTKLFFQGFVQFMKDGELSGSILDELNKAENKGVKDFLGTVLDFGARVMAFFEGVGEGFQGFIADMKPVFHEFNAALTDLGDSLGFFSGDLEDAATGPMANARRSGDNLGIALAKAAVLIVKGLTLVIRIIDTTLEVLDTLGFDLGEVIKFFVEWKIAMAALNFGRTIAGIVSMTGATVTASGVTAAAGAAFTTATTAVAGFATAAWAAVAPFLGPAGLVLAAAAAGAAIGMLINHFGATDAIDNWIGRITGLNEKLAELDRLNGGLTSQRGFGGQDPFGAGRAERLAAEQGLSLQEFQNKRVQELAAEGWDARVNPETGDVEIVGSLNRDESGAAGEGVMAGRPRAADVVAPPAPAVPQQPGEAATPAAQVAEMERTLAALEAQTKRPIQVQVMMDSERIAEATARGERSAKDRAFAPLPAES